MEKDLLMIMYKILSCGLLRIKQNNTVSYLTLDIVRCALSESQGIIANLSPSRSVKT